VEPGTDAVGVPDGHAAVTALLDHPRWEVAPTPDVLELAAAALPAGATVAVTASPGRGVAATVAVAEGLAARGFAAVPHLAARALRDRGELAEHLGRLAAAGVDEVFVVGGDAREPAGPFPDGLALLRAIEDLGRPSRVGVPSYPDGHHRIATDVLWADLRAKQAHADLTVTQLCFDAELVCAFVGEARRRGIDLPVVAGIPGVVDAARLLRISVRIGVADALRFARSHRSTAGALLRPGQHRPDALVEGLAAHVAAGDCALERVHVYTFNQIEPTVRWLAQARHEAA
jgi:methylenetetrahydrofolate reductase (NADPH)